MFSYGPKAEGSFFFFLNKIALDTFAYNMPSVASRTTKTNVRRMPIFLIYFTQPKLPEVRLSSTLMHTKCCAGH